MANPYANLYLYDGNGEYSAVSTGDKATFWESIGNWFTGNKDFERNLETMYLQNTFSAGEADKNRQWQEELSNTAYQRAFADMEKAGLNPYLLYNSAGASTPTGATASASGGYGGKSGKGFDVLLSLIGKLVGTAVQAGTSTAVTASKISAKSLSDALKAETAMDVAKLRAENLIDVAKLNQYRHLHHYKHKP